MGTIYTLASGGRLPSPPVQDRTISGIASAMRLLTFYRERNASRQALREMEDHLLRDIGLTREQAMIEARKPFWRD